MKRLENIRKHGINFEDVVGPFAGPSLDQYDADHSETEERWRRLVWMGRFVAVVTYTEDGEDVRVISARPGNDAQTQLYCDEFFGEPTA